MAHFAVTYHYSDDVAARDAHRAEHREFLGQLLADGVVLASGPWVDGDAGALLIVAADSAEAAGAALDADPFQRESVITAREVREWNIVIGSVG